MCGDSWRRVHTTTEPGACFYHDAALDGMMLQPECAVRNAMRLWTVRLMCLLITTWGLLPESDQKLRRKPVPLLLCAVVMAVVCIKQLRRMSSVLHCHAGVCGVVVRHRHMLAESCNRWHRVKLKPHHWVQGACRQHRASRAAWMQLHAPCIAATRNAIHHLRGGVQGNITTCGPHATDRPAFQASLCIVQAKPSHGLYTTADEVVQMRLHAHMRAGSSLRALCQWPAHHNAPRSPQQQLPPAPPPPRTSVACGTH
jgi:hypothetical protein